jgi:hypothetical protein
MILSPVSFFCPGSALWPPPDALSISEQIEL